MLSAKAKIQMLSAFLRPLLFPFGVIGADFVKAGAVFQNRGHGHGVFAFSDGADGFVERFTKEMGSVKSVVSTGGYSPLVIPYCTCEMVYDADLLLKGMLAIYKRYI